MHRSRKHFDLTCSEWAEATAAADDGSSGGGAGSRRGGGELLVTRTLRFTMPLEPMPFTPKQTAVEKVQRYAQYAGPLLSVESSTRRCGGGDDGGGEDGCKSSKLASIRACIDW